MSRTFLVCTYVFMGVILLGTIAEAQAQPISPGSFTDFRFYRLFGIRPQGGDNNRDSSKRSILDGDENILLAAKRGGLNVPGNERYWLGFGKRSYGNLDFDEQ